MTFRASSSWSKSAENFFRINILALIVLALLPVMAPAAAQPAITFAGSRLAAPAHVAVDGHGNVFVSDDGRNGIVEFLAASNYATTTLIGGAGALTLPGALTLDADGNIFVIDQGPINAGEVTIKEIPAADGYASIKTLPIQNSSFVDPNQIVIDKLGNLFVVNGNQFQILEIPVAAGYTTVTLLQPVLPSVENFIALDGSGNLFVIDRTSDGAVALQEIPAAGGYQTTRLLMAASGVVLLPDSLAFDSQDNLFIADGELTNPFSGVVQGGSAIYEMPAAEGYGTITQLKPAGDLGGPVALSADPAGNLFFLTSFGSNTGELRELSAAGSYTALTTIARATFARAAGIAIDGSGNLFVTDDLRSSVTELTAASGYATATVLPTANGALNQPVSIVADTQGNLFFADFGTNTVREIVAAGGYTTVKTLAADTGNFDNPSDIAIDAQGNLFVCDTLNKVVKEILAAGGYVTVNTLPASIGNFRLTSAVALDAQDNVFVLDGDTGVIAEIMAAGGYTALRTIVPDTTLELGFDLATDSQGNLFVTNTNRNQVKEYSAASDYTASTIVFDNPDGFPLYIAIGASGNPFIVDAESETVQEILLAPPPIAAAMLPGSRSVMAGTTATVFATIANGSGAALEDCGASLLFSAPDGLSLSYRTTDPATNQPTGTANQPVAIPAKSTQSFLLAFSAADALTAPGLAPQFSCRNTAPAAALPGIDTVDLTFSTVPIADIVALAATTTPDLTLHLADGVGAFAVATLDAGAADTLTVTADTGDTPLPIGIVLCQTDASARCQGSPAAAIPVGFTPNAAPTFSIFVSTTGQIPFAPGTARIFVRFKDSAGRSHGVTSVAVETD